MYTAHIAYLSACLRSIKAQVLTTRIFPTSRTAQSEPRRSETPHAKRLSSTFKVTGLALRRKTLNNQLP